MAAKRHDAVTGEAQGTGFASRMKEKPMKETVLTVELTAQEMELVLHALKEYGKRKEELPRIPIENLVARLELVERQQREAPDRAIRQSQRVRVAKVWKHEGVGHGWSAGS